MKSTVLIFLTFLTISGYAQKSDQNKSQKTEIILLGTLHFNQFHNAKQETTNFRSERRQNEFNAVVQSLSKFKPDAIFIEREPTIQKKIDSLYSLKVSELDSLPDALSEVYQLGFKLAKKNKLSTVYGVDYYESVSQNLFKSGSNLEMFVDSLKNFQNVGRGITKAFLQGKLTISDFLLELNKPENIKMSYRLFYNTPAYVVDGTFKNEERFDQIDNAYIGAEYISIFYERNLKIYSNILRFQNISGASRIIFIVGQVHVGVLEHLLNENPNFKVVSPVEFLQKK